MGISELLSGLWSESDSAADRAEPAVHGRPSQSRRTVIYECRNCGTTVSVDTDRCPTCDSDGIAAYTIE